ncbi:hypothetical protein [Pseudomonas mediterranea]|uniref:hypothetical protein n=1 Tax=Pseudomonas mediterranea TaxID=183795 RepID=UPI0012B5ED41|nr:hypothetical protein [Pseudomonas mediterranea]
MPVFIQKKRFEEPAVKHCAENLQAIFSDLYAEEFGDECLEKLLLPAVHHYLAFAVL